MVKGPLTSISLAILAVVASSAPTSPFNARDTSSSNGTSSNNGLTDKVSWDEYSIYVDNEPLTLLSGEFHYYRLPSPDLWTDIMQKYKALGFNGASFYFNWGYHSPKRGVYDFDGVRDVQKALDAAKASGIHVISRPGPYINAEVDCGGFPSWLMNTKSMSRQDNPEYEAAWTEWLTEIDKKYLVPNQITEGGPIIMQQVENEYSSNVSLEYMQAIIDKYRKDGIVVPTSFNEVNNNSKNFINGTGAVDLYGWDNYPAGFDCSHPDKWGTSAIKTYRDHHMEINPSKPQALYEFQGGAFDPWGGPGYDKCRTMINEKYAKVYYKNNLAQGVRIQSLYMGYGGTSWGGLATPSVYTSYDYGAAISEPGLMTPKAYEHKLQATFVHTAKDITATTAFDVKGDNDALVYNGLQSVHSDTQFIIVQHNQSDSDDRDEFTVPIETKDGKFTIPRKSSLVLNGRDAKILVADYDFESQHLVYSTSEIFTHQSLGKTDVMLVYAYEDEDGEVALKATNGSAKATDGDITTSSADGIFQINYKHPNGTMPIQVTGAGDKDLLLLVAGYDSATRWWAPEISTDARVLIQGPYLVRDAKLSGSTLSFTGDIDATTDILVVAPDNVDSFQWNDKKVELQKQSDNLWKGTLTFDKPNLEISDLSKATWKYKAASPETVPDFDDSTWVDADHQDTNATVAPETKPVLYADDYGFHTGNLWFRGTFKGSSDITGLNVTAYSGDGSAWVAWLNGKYLGGYDVGSHVFENLNLTDGDNVLSLLLWTTGHEEDGPKDDRFKSPRGFTKVEAMGSSNTTISWKVQGNLGGEDLADPVRGAYNEGGLYGEREGWHLPGFDDGDWESATIPDTKNRTGVSWFRTTFKANVPKGYDAPLGLTFEDDSKQRYRALVFVNGWQLGRYANDLGPQKTYYLPEGIVNVKNGENTLAIAVIPLDESSQIGALSLAPYLVLESGKPQVGLVDSPEYSKRK